MRHELVVPEQAFIRMLFELGCFWAHGVARRTYIGWDDYRAVVLGGLMPKTGFRKHFRDYVADYLVSTIYIAAPGQSQICETMVFDINDSREIDSVFEHDWQSLAEAQTGHDLIVKALHNGDDLNALSAALHAVDSFLEQHNGN